MLGGRHPARSSFDLEDNLDEQERAFESLPGP